MWHFYKYIAHHKRKQITCPKSLHISSPLKGSQMAGTEGPFLEHTARFCCARCLDCCYLSYTLLWDNSWNPSRIATRLKDSVTWSEKESRGLWGAMNHTGNWNHRANVDDDSCSVITELPASWRHGDLQVKGRRGRSEVIIIKCKS